MIKSDKEIVDILIPTYENEQQLEQCVASILTHRNLQPMRIIVINNGKIPIRFENSEVEVINAGKNLGWEGGLKEGLKHSKSKYVMFANDDIFIPVSSMFWLKEMVRYMDSFPVIGAIGPSSNVVMGIQNIFNQPVATKMDAPFLIGFCMLLRREALDKAGGVDDSLSGGDDIDLSIRLRQAGYKLIVRKDIFVWHHGFQTGNKLHGGPERPGGWNSREMSDNTNIGLVKKHGLKAFIETMFMFAAPTQPAPGFLIEAGEDVEGNIIRQELKQGEVLELGCGANKTIPTATGVDIVPNGETIPELLVTSAADIVADVEEGLPFVDEKFDAIISRHILEHCADPIKTLQNWLRVLKKGGQLFIALPDESRGRTIQLNSQHVHVFTPESLRNIGNLLGLNHVKTFDKEIEYSFVTIFEK